MIAECDTQIEAQLKTWADREPPTPPERQLPPAKPKSHGHKKGSPNFDVQPLLEQKAGVDLTRVTGIDSHTALKHGLEYVDPGQEWYEKAYHQRLITTFMRRARELGLKLISKASTSATEPAIK